MRKETYWGPAKDGGKKGGGNIQKHTKNLTKKKKKKKKKTQIIVNVFSPIISTIWREWVLVDSGRKTPGPTSSLPTPLPTK